MSNNIVDRLRAQSPNTLAMRDAADHIERLSEENSALRAAAHDVCAFDWSDNDEDAVAAISWLRALLNNMDKKPA